VAIVYQISLNGDAFDARGKDWIELEAESGCKRDTEWKDPILDRHMLETEFGCAVSHLRVWRKIANSGLNGIILEEDAIFESIDVTNVDAVLKHHDSAWLGYRKNTLGYWYNCHAYALTPTTARLLIDGFSENIIPVDEWVPLTLLMQKKENYFFEPERV
jgi:GR25 family glycosyltransferase involved in LPS biosynthesis